jgi:uncharacterized Zn-binding protein involved in type VI secretion
MGSRPFIVQGDRTSHGGVVIEASQVTFTHDKPIARVGDQVTCPIPGHGTTIITTGDQTMIIDGKAAARHGDQCACGAVLISSQVVSTTGDGGASNPQAASQAQRDNAAAHGIAPAASPAQIDEAPSQDGQFDDKFKLVDDETGEPLANTGYAVKRASGAIEHGTTDDEGHTHLLASTAAIESVEIYA